MTLRQFATATGWPYREMMNLYVSEFSEILALMGLRLAFYADPDEDDDENDPTDVI